MFKFKSSTLILSASCLLTLGCLLVVSSAVHTSNVDHNPNLDQSSNHHEASIDAGEGRAVSNGTAELRGRSARVYSQSNYGNQQQSALADSYAAAYAAANGPASGQTSDQELVQSAVQGASGDSYASFGESSPSSGSSASASALRQIPASDYSPHSSYYSAYSSPSSQSAGGYGGPSSNYHYQHYRKSSPPAGYPSNGYDRQAAASYYDGSYLSASSIPLWAQSSIPSSGGIMSSASSALSHWTGGFGISEIICTLLAISIGAIILGAPFFLIYLALMGNFSGSGTLSLTNPTGTATPAAASAAVNGRRKRLAIFEQLASPIGQQNHPDLSALADTVMNKLSPYIDMQQVTTTFKRLADSIEKYSNLKPETPKKRSV